MSGGIYFDITDIVKYAEGNDRVSGIQRVQFNLIAHLVRRHGGEIIRCIFHHASIGSVVEIDPSLLFESDEFDSAILLQQLGLEPGHRWLPSRSQLKRYLSRYDNKWRRALAKTTICLWALLRPGRLAPLGLRRRPKVHPVVPRRRIDALPASAHCVQTSANITSAPMLAFVRAHALRGGDVVQIVYDLIPQLHPEYFRASAVRDYRAWLDEMVRQAPRAICISDCTANDLRAHLGARAKDWDIRAIALAHEFDGFARDARVEAPAARSDRWPPAPFVLCVGTFEVRKNGLGLLAAWQRLIGEFGASVPTLVFAGKRGWLMEGFLAALASSPELAKTVRLIESPTDAELAWLYGQCLFTVYPSLYEGWGLPVGESAWFGKYCIASHASSVPEVCGDLIDYVDPADAADIARQVAHALRDPDYVRRRELALRRAPLRRWRDVADDIHRIVMSPRAPIAERHPDTVSA